MTGALARLSALGFSHLATVLAEAADKREASRVAWTALWAVRDERAVRAANLVTAWDEERREAERSAS